MTRKRYSLAAMAATILFVAAPAHAATIGITTPPSGTTPGSSCGPGIIGQKTSDPATPFEVPAGGGQITQWQLNTAGGTPGDSVTFVLLRPNAGGTTYNVVGTDTESLPSPLPPVASFNISTPISANAGDTMGLFAPASSLSCYFQGSSLPATDVAMALAPAGGPPATGQTLTVAETGPQIVTNVAANVQQSEDIAATAAAGPAGAAVGSLGQLSALVSNGGLAAGPVTVVDNVPAGLTISSAVAGGGTCTVAGQVVTCAIASLAPGSSVPVVVTVVPTHAGSYANTFSATPASLPDPNPANNTASATLNVGPAVVAASNACVVPPLGGVSLRVAKRILRALHCKPGKVSRAHSRRVPRGAVIRTTPSTGDFRAGKKVNLTISSGKPKKKRRGH